MTVYRNDKGLWSIRYKYKDNNGVWQQKMAYSGKSGFTRKKDAIEKEKDIIQEIQTSLLKSLENNHKTFKEVMDEIRHTPKWKELYPKRKESIERVFGDCKEHHNLRYTRLRGLQKNQHQALMIFACHNLKRMTRWRWKTSSNTIHNWLKMMISRFETQKEKRYSFWSITLSTI
ncbi:transposase [Candidatus Stoquefichus massiliensis]|uniref:transposase n=1 Tax=Candidatus Stoquefichus massiliensis TaxID=1470350 RepID=UPI0004874754|nr:transposase [Candidatus Stoquefichus massiliensis]